MKNIKTFLALTGTAVMVMAAPLSVMVTTTGCGTITGSPTNSPAQIAATALILQNAAYSGALVAITPPQGNTGNIPYFQLASQSLGLFITGTNYSPAALQAALVAVHVPGATNIWVQLGIGTVVDLYQVYFSQYVQGQVSGNAAAIAFLTAIQAGFNQALGSAAPLPAPPMPPAPPVLGLRAPILPRPLK